MMCSEFRQNVIAVMMLARANAVNPANVVKPVNGATVVAIARNKKVL